MRQKAYSKIGQIGRKISLLLVFTVMFGMFPHYTFAAVDHCIVAFDPDDEASGYNDFYKVTVPVGSVVTEQPQKPVRDGYVFRGWYAYEDVDGNPVFWNFETDTVTNNTTLWASWEKACIVAFDPDDGVTGYNDFYKVTVPIGSTVTQQAEEPARDGYVFRGWYAYEDADGNPVLWNFETDTVTDNITLWASWETAGNTGSGTEPGEKTAPEETINDDDEILQNGNESRSAPKTGDESFYSGWLLWTIISSFGVIILLMSKSRTSVKY